jgi:hypothetical protein
MLGKARILRPRAWIQQVTMVNRDTTTATEGTGTDVQWTDVEVAKRLEGVREALLDFLRLRTRLERFRRKARWRLSRRHVWPGASAADTAALDEAVDGAAGVQAFRTYVVERQRTITEAIERYNHALRRHMEKTLGVPARELDDVARAELHRRRITFQGTRDELRRLARQVGRGSDPESFSELLSLRLALLTEDVRDEIFSEVAALVADEHASEGEEMSVEERELAAMEVDLRLRCLDRYHVARLLAQNYAEARRFMDVDALLQRYRDLAREERVSENPDAVRLGKMAILREVLSKTIAWLEQIFPASAGTHTRETLLLRRPEA